MKKYRNLCLAAAWLPCALLNAQQWDYVHPGTGGNIMRLNCDPTIDGRVYASTDVTGTYRSNNNGNTWTYIDEGTQHSLTFTLEVDPNNSNILWQGNLYGVDKSTNGGNSWTAMNLPVDGATGEGDAIADILVRPGNSNQVLAAPGWKMKAAKKSKIDNNGNLKSDTLDVPQPLVGERTLYYTNNGGSNWTRENYDPSAGNNNSPSTQYYRHVYKMVFRSATQQGQVLIGAHSGVYKRTLSNGQGNYVRLPEPSGVVSGRYAQDDTGGCRGIVTSLDGKWLYALWVVNSGSNETRLYAYDLDQGNNGTWQALNMGGSQGPDGKNTEWGYIQIDPLSTTPNSPGNPPVVHRVLIGQIREGGVDRVGLWEGTISLNSTGSAINGISWEIVGGNSNQGFTYDGGWTNVEWGSHSFTYAPASWSNRYIFALGANNIFRGNQNASGWPTTNAWTPVYCTNVGSVGGKTAYQENGIAATVNWDMGVYENYAIQNMADEGISESFDGGASWNHKANIVGTTKNPNRSNSVEILRYDTNAPLVLAHFAKGYGTIANNGGLYAKKLVNQNSSSSDDWKLIGGIAFDDHDTKAPFNTPESTDSNVILNGLPCVVYEDIAAAKGDQRIVYIATDNLGVYRTSNIYNLFNNGGSPFEEIISPTQLKDVHHLEVDPNNDNRVYAIGGFDSRGFYIITGSGSNWSAQKINLPDYSGNPTSANKFNKPKEIAVWDHNGSTRIAIVREITGSSSDAGDVLYSTNGGTSWSIVGDVIDMMAPLSPTPGLPGWYDANTTGFNDPQPASIAAEGNNLYVFVHQNKHRLNFGTFKGVLNGNNATWSDFTGSGSNRHYYAKSWRSDVFEHGDGSKWLYSATFGSGTVRTPLAGSGGGGSSNLLANAGFESGLQSPWNGGSTVSVVTSPDPVQSGEYALQIEKTGSAGYTSSNQTVSASANTAYTLSGFVRQQLSAGSARIRAICLNSSGGTITTFNSSSLSGNSTSFTNLTETFTTPTGTAEIQVQLQLVNALGQVYFDGMKLEAQ